LKSSGATLNGEMYLFGGGTSIESPQRYGVVKVRSDISGLDWLDVKIPVQMVEHSCATVVDSTVGAKVLLCGAADTVSGATSRQCYRWMFVGTNIFFTFFLIQ
jgi:hypothetical protein